MILRQFAENDRVHVQDLITGSCETKKLKDVYAENGLFPEEVEEKMSRKIEGRFGDLLNHKLLLPTNTIKLDRKENMLLRVFMLLEVMRNVKTNQSLEAQFKYDRENKQRWRTPLEQQVMETIYDHSDSTVFPCDENYIENLYKIAEYDSLEELLQDVALPMSILTMANIIYSTYIAIWDAGDDEEFILPSVTGISSLDSGGVTHKSVIMYHALTEMPLSPIVRFRTDYVMRNMIGGLVDNYLFHVISPKRCIVCISPYFKLFFPQKKHGKQPAIPKTFPSDIFKYHFSGIIPRMELFEPCDTTDNQNYRYVVKHLNNDETKFMNALMLNEEKSKYVFKSKKYNFEELYEQYAS